MTGTTGRASNTNAAHIAQNLCTANGSSQSSIIYPPQSPTRITNNSILKLAGAFHCVKTSSIRFWAFSYSVGDPCGRSNQLIMYFIGILLIDCVETLGTIDELTRLSIVSQYHVRRRFALKRLRLISLEVGS